MANYSRTKIWIMSNYIACICAWPFLRQSCQNLRSHQKPLPSVASTELAAVLYGFRVVKLSFFVAPFLAINSPIKLSCLTLDINRWFRSLASMLGLHPRFQSLVFNHRSASLVGSCPWLRSWVPSSLSIHGCNILFYSLLLLALLPRFQSLLSVLVVNPLFLSFVSIRACALWF